ncbi:3-Oxoacyl-[acyl-carrier-protein (ACP)] synthase III [Fragilaria crotonensis]|nr:3-Oxoacyl-[acyl-carrier-protein (ACP)] synthase III [Fragilaria crotonensis]
MLVIGADALSRWVDWDDRNSCILFGDGAGAMVLTQDLETSGVLGYAAHSNGEGHEDLTLSITAKSSFGCHSWRRNGVEYWFLRSGCHEWTRSIQVCHARGSKVLLELDAAGMTVDDVDWLLLHQANIRIMEAVATRLGIPMEKVIANLGDYGNTSAASIPLALDEAVRSGKVKPGDVIACADLELDCRGVLPF